MFQPLFARIVKKNGIILILNHGSSPTAGQGETSSTSSSAHPNLPLTTTLENLFETLFWRHIYVCVTHPGTLGLSNLLTWPERQTWYGTIRYVNTDVVYSNRVTSPGHKWHGNGNAMNMTGRQAKIPRLWPLQVLVFLPQSCPQTSALAALWLKPRSPQAP